MIDPSEASTQIKDFVTKVYQIRQEVEHLFDYFQLSDAAQNLSLHTSWRGLSGTTIPIPGQFSKFYIQSSKVGVSSLRNTINLLVERFT